MRRAGYYAQNTRPIKPFSARFLRAKCRPLLPCAGVFPHTAPMPTYIYQTIPKKKGQKPKRFELVQSMKDKPLKKHPETGEPVERVITGGCGVVFHGPSIMSMNVPRGRK